jgi:ubiquinol-cytochrome c reductase cytochrome b subunit
VKKLDLRALLRDRTGFGTKPTSILAGGASFAHVFGAVLLLLLAVEALTGAALAAFYSPSTTDAWASVAYIEDQVSYGWLVRGLHFHAGSAIVIVAGVHLVQTAVWGAYKKPRELTWWLGIILLLLVLGFAVTGYILRWDQAGYWANRVEVGIAASTPAVGESIRKLALGGNEYGNLTLTRFYALHVIALPAIVALVTFVHVWLARRHGPTPSWGKKLHPTPRWPDQTIRDVLAMAVTFAILLGYVASQHGAGLAAPADPTASYDARPLWYFRWLFELRELAGSWEKLAALAAPAVVAVLLISLPLVDRGESRAPRARAQYIAIVLVLFAVIGAMTMGSFHNDSDDPDLAKRQKTAEDLAIRARHLAIKNGVPVTGGQDVFKTVTMWRERTIYETRCKSCHDAQSKDRKGPIIGAGHGNRAWLTSFIKAPNSDPFWGKTKLGHSDAAMKEFSTLPAEDLDAVVEAMYAESGAADAIASKVEHGRKVYKSACDDCHSRDEDTAGPSGPGLYGLGTRAYYARFIGNPKSPLHMGDGKSEMPRFDKELTIVERDLVAGYLVWLRTATQADVDALDPLD